MHEKLIRDKIPEIATQPLDTRIETDPEKILEFLGKKIQEESEEVIESLRQPLLVIEELADLLEVVDAICEVLDVDFNDIMEAKQAKYAERGGFSKNLILQQGDK